jgi:hypothetical protein
MTETFLDESNSGSAWAAEASGAAMFALYDRDKCREVRNIERYLRRALVAALLAAGLMVNTPALAQDKKPNILFALMDNLGYGELGVYGGGILRGAPTPRIDELAAEGTRLTNFNVEAQCTPSRSAIMTGRFSIRSGTQSVPIGGEFDGLTRWEVTIAQALSAAGYATGAFGK